MTVSVRIDDLCIGATSPQKVVHHRRCHHARADYKWARQFATAEDLADALIRDGAIRWHRFCQVCCGDVDDAVRARRSGGDAR